MMRFTPTGGTEPIPDMDTTVLNDLNRCPTLEGRDGVIYLAVIKESQMGSMMMAKLPVSFLPEVSVVNGKSSKSSFSAISIGSTQPVTNATGTATTNLSTNVVVSLLTSVPGLFNATNAAVNANGAMVNDLKAAVASLKANQDTMMTALSGLKSAGSA